MTIDEAIKHCEEESCENRKLAKRYDDASGYTRSGNEDVRTSDAKKCERCAKEYNQIAEWLKDYKRLLEQEHCEDCISRQAAIKNVAQIAKAAAKSDKQKSLCGRIIFMLEHMSEVSE